MSGNFQPGAAYRPSFAPLPEPWLPPALLEHRGLPPLLAPEIALFLDLLLAPGDEPQPWLPPAVPEAVPAARGEPDREGGPRRDPPGHEGRVIVTHGSEIGVDLPVDPPGTSGDLLTWRIAGGEDAARFLMDPATGALRFLVAPNPGRPNDTDHDGFYELVIEAKDVWGAIALQPLRIHPVPGGGDQAPALPFRADLAGGAEGCLGPFEPAPLDTTAWSAREWAMI